MVPEQADWQAPPSLYDNFDSVLLGFIQAKLSWHIEPGQIDAHCDPLLSTLTLLAEGFSQTFVEALEHFDILVQVVLHADPSLSDTLAEKDVGGAQ